MGSSESLFRSEPCPPTRTLNQNKLSSYPGAELSTREGFGYVLPASPRIPLAIEVDGRASIPYQAYRFPRLPGPCQRPKRS